MNKRVAKKVLKNKETLCYTKGQIQKAEKVVARRQK